MKQKKTHVNVGTIGHIDHSLTTLTATIARFGAERSKVNAPVLLPDDTTCGECRYIPDPVSRILVLTPCPQHQSLVHANLFAPVEPR